MQWLIERVAVGISSAVIVAASVTAVSAAPIVFTNEADFNAAIAAAGITLGVESFEGQTTGPQAAPLVLDPFTLSTAPPAPALIAITNNANHVTHGTKAVAASPGLQPLVFTFDTAIRAFSIDVVDAFNGSGGNFFGRIDGGAQQTFFTGGSQMFGRTFLGILDLDAAFTTLQFDGDGNIGSFTIDRVQFDAGGANPTPVPEPASLTLLGFGLIAASARFRKRRVRR